MGRLIEPNHKYHDAAEEALKGSIPMGAEHCVCCGVIIPEGTQVCINCMSGCIECGWDDKENCKACEGQKGDSHAEIDLHSGY